ncbi:hypothetical protein Tco_0199216 [Tanacetum coccineum]
MGGCKACGRESSGGVGRIKGRVLRSVALQRMEGKYAGGRGGKVERGSGLELGDEHYEANLEDVGPCREMRNGGLLAPMGYESYVSDSGCERIRPGPEFTGERPQSAVPGLKRDDTDKRGEGSDSSEMMIGIDAEYCCRNGSLVGLAVRPLSDMTCGLGARRGHSGGKDRSGRERKVGWGTRAKPGEIFRAEGRGGGNSGTVGLTALGEELSRGDLHSRQFVTVYLVTARKWILQEFCGHSAEIWINGNMGEDTQSEYSEGPGSWRPDLGRREAGTGEVGLRLEGTQATVALKGNAAVVQSQQCRGTRGGFPTECVGAVTESDDKDTGRSETTVVQEEWCIHGCGSTDTLIRLRLHGRLGCEGIWTVARKGGSAAVKAGCVKHSWQPQTDRQPVQQQELSRLSWSVWEKSNEYGSCNCTDEKEIRIMLDEDICGESWCVICRGGAGRSGGVGQSASEGDVAWCWWQFGRLCCIRLVLYQELCDQGDLSSYRHDRPRDSCRGCGNKPHGLLESGEVVWGRLKIGRFWGGEEGKRVSRGRMGTELESQEGHLDSMAVRVSDQAFFSAGMEYTGNAWELNSSNRHRSCSCCFHVAAVVEERGLRGWLRDGRSGREGRVFWEAIAVGGLGVLEKPPAYARLGSDTAGNEMSGELRWSLGEAACVCKELRWGSKEEGVMDEGVKGNCGMLTKGSPWNDIVNCGENVVITGTSVSWRGQQEDIVRDEAWALARHIRNCGEGVAGSTELGRLGALIAVGRCTGEGTERREQRAAGLMKEDSSDLGEMSERSVKMPNERRLIWELKGENWSAGEIWGGEKKGEHGVLGKEAGRSGLLVDSERRWICKESSGRGRKRRDVSGDRIGGPSGKDCGLRSPARQLSWTVKECGCEERRPDEMLGLRQRGNVNGCILWIPSGLLGSGFSKGRSQAGACMVGEEERYDSVTAYVQDVRSVRVPPPCTTVPELVWCAGADFNTSVRASCRKRRHPLKLLSVRGPGESDILFCMSACDREMVSEDMWDVVNLLGNYCRKVEPCELHFWVAPGDLQRAETRDTTIRCDKINKHSTQMISMGFWVISGRAGLRRGEGLWEGEGLGGDGVCRGDLPGEGEVRGEGNLNGVGRLVISTQDDWSKGEGGEREVKTRCHAWWYLSTVNWRRWSEEETGGRAWVG